MSRRPTADPLGDGLRPWGIFALLLLTATAAQSTLAYPLHALTGAQPDFLLTVVLCTALLSDAATGCVLGFVGGLLSAALIGQTLGTLLVTRTIAGFLAGRFTARVFQANLLVIVLGVFIASLAAYVLQALSHPPRTGLTPWLQATLGGGIWNAALALPIASLLRHSGWGGPSPRLR
ncbi:MAG: rod shape-determining protein MreD [Cytophagales bacterium]|nr:rod shape-determining protein MreD [Armatimonadota bacterium]